MAEVTVRQIGEGAAFPSQRAFADAVAPLLEQNFEYDPTNARWTASAQAREALETHTMVVTRLGDFVLGTMLIAPQGYAPVFTTFDDRHAEAEALNSALLDKPEAVYYTRGPWLSVRVSDVQSAARVLGAVLRHIPVEAAVTDIPDTSRWLPAQTVNELSTGTIETPEMPVPHTFAIPRDNDAQTVAAHAARIMTRTAAGDWDRQIGAYGTSEGLSVTCFAPPTAKDASSSIMNVVICNTPGFGFVNYRPLRPEQAAAAATMMQALAADIGGMGDI